MSEKSGWDRMQSDQRRLPPKMRGRLAAITCCPGEGVRFSVLGERLLRKTSWCRVFGWCCCIRLTIAVFGESWSRSGSS